MNHRAKLNDLTGSALIALMVGASMTLSLLDSMALSHSVAQVVTVCLGLSLLCALTVYNKITLVVALSALAIGGFVLYQNERLLEELGNLAETISSLGRGEGGSIDGHAVIIALIFATVFTLIMFFLSRMSGGIYPALTLAALMILGGWLFEKRLTPMYLLPSLIGLAILFARSRAGQTIPWLRALPVAILAAALALWTVPGGRVTWPPLEEAAQQVRQLFEDYFMFTSPRTVYSISADGFQPDGELLGGPANPRDADVMRVTADRVMLLRGSLRRTYTGASWVDNALGSRYLMIDPGKRGLRDGIFNINLADSLAQVTRAIDADVTMLAEGTSTLFVPGRITSVSASPLLPIYHNDSGEVFFTRGVEPGDQYRFSALLIDAGDDELARLTAAASGRDDPGYQHALDHYMNLPRGIDDQVYWLTQRLIEGADTPYAKATAIRDHLLNNYTYELSVDFPPRNRDFVSYFLMTSKQGYCSYFASAMAVMARMAGLPSRYVEGYVVRPELGSDTIVRGEDAHAWTEIYFRGVGWLSFDATPGYDQSPDDHVPPDEPDAPPHEPDEPDETPAPEEPDETPEPEETPEPDDSDPDDTDPDPTPEPDDDDSGSSEDDPNDPNDDEDDSQNRFAWLWVLLLIALLALATAIIARRVRSSDPNRMAARYDDDAVKLLVWYRALLTLIYALGHSPAPGESPEAFAERLVADSVAPEEFLEFARRLSLNRYAHRAPDEAGFELAASAYADIVGRLPLRAKIRWMMGRIARGLGDIRAIP